MQAIKRALVVGMGLSVGLVAYAAKAADAAADPVHDAREREVRMWYPPPLDLSIEQGNLVSVAHFGPDLYVHWHVAKKIAGARYKRLPGKKGFLVAPSSERPKPGNYALYSRSKGRQVAECSVTEVVSIVSGAKNERNTLNPKKSIYVPGECGELRFLWGKLHCSEPIDVDASGEGLTDYWLLPGQGVAPVPFSEVPTAPDVADRLRKDALQTSLVQGYLAERIKQQGQSKFYEGCPAPIVAPFAVRTYQAPNRTVAFVDVGITKWIHGGNNPNVCSELGGGGERSVIYDVAPDGTFKPVTACALAFPMESDALMGMPDGELARIRVGDGKQAEEAELSHITFSAKDNNWVISHTIVWKLCQFEDIDD